MFYNFKIILRNLRRDKFYSAINIGGLAISLTICAFIMLWAWDEMSFDRFHTNAAQIYRVNQKIFDNYSGQSVEAVAPAATSEFPEIDNTCRVGYYYGASFWEYDDNRFYSSAFRGGAVDPSFFNMFDFKIERGDAFSDPLSMVISETKAKTFFGDDDPIGKIIRSSHDKLFHITGVMKDMPENTQFQYDYFVPFIALQLDYYSMSGAVEVENWKGNIVETYFQLMQGVDATWLAGKIGEMATRRANSETAFLLQPLSKLHTYFPNGQPAGIKTVRLFSIIAALILLIACINYVNLVTARATNRNREISVKKILGGKRKRLIGQLTAEAFLLFFAALVISTLFVALLFPMFNTIAGKELTFNLFGWPMLCIYGGTTAAFVLLAGLYPAIHLSSFQPLDAFRGGASGQGIHRYLRKSLVVVQFVFSFGLIVAMIVIGSQLNYMRKIDLGYDKENVFTFEVRNMYMHYETVKNELMKNPAITGVSGAAGGGRNNNLNWDGKTSDDNPYIVSQQIVHDYLQLMNVSLTSGEYLSENDNKHVLINEEAVRIMGMDNPIGKRIWSDVNARINYTVKGVVKDYHFANLRTPIQPLMLTLTGNPLSINVKTTDGGVKSALASVEKLWQEYNPNNEFAYSFLEEQFDRMYKADLQVGKLLNIFAIVAIFLSLLGLLGLITFVAETKIKEIGIRKVMGAEVNDIITLLSKEFLLLVGIAMLLAFPLAYYWLERMLQDYAYRISISWWMFASAGIITITLTLITVGWRAMKAATADPVKAIKVS